MLGYYDRIQGTDRLLRIRRIRRVVFVAILSLTILLLIARLGSEGASLKPFFLPLNGIIELSLMMGLVTAIVGLYFRHLEIQRVQRDGQRYLMAKSSMARAFRTAGFAIGLAVILLLAVTPSLAATIFSDAPQVVSLAPQSRENVTFTSPDPLGVSFVTHAIVTVTAGTASVTLQRNSANVSSTWTLNASERVIMDVELTMWEESASWSLALQNPTNSITYVTFVLEKGVVPTFFSTLPLLLFLYGGTQIAWWVVLRPIRERTRSSSLVSAPDIDSGERVFDGTTPAANPTRDPREEAIMPKSVANPPAPPAPAARPPPVRAPVQAPRAEPPAPALRPPVRQPETAESLATKADALVATGTFEAALAAYDDALRLDPRHMGSLEGRATCLTRLNRKGEAIEAYRRIVSRDPKKVAALRSIARLHAGERRWRECLEAVDDVLRVRPNEPGALELKGDALTNLGRRPEALAAYEGAAAVDPANETLRQKIEEVRVDVPGLLSRALIGSASGNYVQALALFDEILEVDESNVNALIGKAVAYRRSGKPLEAVNCLDLVLGVQPNNASALLNRGSILQEEGDLEGAFDAFDRLTELYPTDGEAWAAQGDVLEKMGRDDDALRAYTEAQKLSPGDEEIQRHILELEAARTGQSDIFEELFAIKGIGKARAKALIDAGFKTAEDFAKASPRDLMVVRGVTRKIAEELKDHFRSSLAEAR
jgi:tetratricopeptide (TPR) repeat protein